MAPDLMVELATAVLPEAQAVTPVESGALVDSEHVEPTPTGAALVADTDYAVLVHEDLQADHATGGPRFLTEPTEQRGPDLATAVLRGRL